MPVGARSILPLYLAGSTPNLTNLWWFFYPSGVPHAKRSIDTALTQRTFFRRMVRPTQVSTGSRQVMHEAGRVRGAGGGRSEVVVPCVGLLMARFVGIVLG